MKVGDIYRSKFLVCNDDARYIIILLEYLSNDMWKCGYGILPDNFRESISEESIAGFMDKNNDMSFIVQMLNTHVGGTITGKVLYELYEKVN